VADFYYKALLKGSRGLKYLAKLGLEDSHLLESFGIGLCDGTLMNVLAASDPIRRDFLRLGLAIEQDVQLAERFLNHVTVPFTDSEGGMIGLWGIHVRSGDTVLVPEKALPVWNLPAARIYPEILLCGNIIDGLSLVRAGFPNVLALAGGRLGAEGVARLQSIGVQKLVVIAGKEIVNRIRPLCTGLVFAGVAVPPEQSPNSILIRDGTAGLVSFIEQRLKLIPAEHSASRGVEGQVAHEGEVLSA